MSGPKENDRTTEETAPDCICAEINARHCPIHNEETEPVEFISEDEIYKAATAYENKMAFPGSLLVAFQSGAEWYAKTVKERGTVVYTVDGWDAWFQEKKQDIPYDKTALLINIQPVQPIPKAEPEK